jgi:hypothetical protein
MTVEAFVQKYPNSLTPFVSLFVEDVNIEASGTERFIIRTIPAKAVPLLGHKYREGIRSWNCLFDFESKLHRT